MTGIGRRACLVGLACVAASCAKKPRCRRCGMVLDPRGRFYAELRGPGDAREGFDTPKCALTALRSLPDATGRTLWVTAYYAGALVPATEVLFAVGSDVVGPMGHDLVPVERARAVTFGRDHAAKELLPLEQITRELAEGT